MPNKQRTYTIKEKREAIQDIAIYGVEQVARDLQCPRGTVDGWWRQRAKILAFRGNATSKTLKGQGRKEIYPHVAALITYMKDERREEKALTTSGMIDFMCHISESWITSYLQGKKRGRAALERLCQRVAERNGFSSQKPQLAKMSSEALEEIRVEFAVKLWEEYEAFAGGGMYNVDETAINFDMPPIRIWALKGRRDPAHIADTTKHAGRMTAVLTIRDDGEKLPTLFIVRGKLGGLIDQRELCEYPKGHYYTVQANTWMDATGWRFYVENVLQFEIDKPSILLLDNFESHVSEKSQRIVAELASTTVVPLPPNSTSVCQPLDVGVMGPLKVKLRAKFSGITSGTAKEKRIRAIKATIAAWEDISEDTVIRSFEKAIPHYPEVTI